MYYDHEKEPDGLGFVATAIVGGTAILSSVLGIGSKYWAQKEGAEAQKKALKGQAAAARLEQGRINRELARQQTRAIQEAKFTEASTRRRNSIYAMYAVGGVATAISLVLIAGAVSKRRRAPANAPGA